MGTTCLPGSAEVVPLPDGVADLVFLSMVYHHIRDRAKAHGEFRRVLKPGGWLCIRTSTRELIDTYLWIRFFPGPREIEERRIPSSGDLREGLEGCGFRLEAHEVVSQVFAEDLWEYYRKISLHGLSSLQSIPDETFEEGDCSGCASTVCRVIWVGQSTSGPSCSSLVRLVNEGRARKSKGWHQQQVHSAPCRVSVPAALTA